MKVAVIGATGTVGRQMLSELEEWDAPLEVSAFASYRSDGVQIPFKNGHIKVQAFDLAKVQGAQFILMSAGSAFSREWAEKLAAQKAWVIDNSSAWRMKADVPLVVPEINKDTLGGGDSGIVSVPNCVAIPAAAALSPLDRAFGIQRADICSYQSVSGSGQKGVLEFSQQIAAHLRFETVAPTVYPQPIAYNVIPAIGEIQESGFCEEEEKIIQEIQKILSSPDLDVSASVARVPVFYGHSAAITVDLKKPVTIADVEEVWGQIPSLVYYGGKDLKALPSPYFVAQSKEVHISRLRLKWGSRTSGTRLHFWVVADNLRKGAATTATDIMTALMERQGLKP
jgi:aspartate-semialdehyde dehydrogenase